MLKPNNNNNFYCLERVLIVQIQPKSRILIKKNAQKARLYWFFKHNLYFRKNDQLK